jgi:hypothetical protein
MPKKTRATRQQQARRRPTPRPAAGPGAPTAVPSPGASSVGVATPDAESSGAAAATPDAEAAGVTSAARTGTLPATSRRVARVDPGTGRRLRPQQKQVSTFPPLDSDDPAIPFDRVPYVPADLRRVAVIAAIMVVLIIVASVVVSHVVG